MLGFKFEKEKDFSLIFLKFNDKVIGIGNTKKKAVNSFFRHHFFDKMYNFLNKIIFKKLCDKYLLKEIRYDLERVKYIIEQNSIIYCEITQNRMSYPWYSAGQVIQECNEILHEKYIEKDALDGLTKEKLFEFLEDNNIKIRN